MKINKKIRIKVLKRIIKDLKRWLPKPKDPDTFFRMTNQYDEDFEKLYHWEHELSKLKSK